MKLARTFSFLAVLVAVALMSGCVPPYRQTFEDAAKENHWTHKQMLAALAWGDRVWWAREMKEGSNQYVFIYGKVPTAKVAAQIQQVLVDINGILDPNDPGARQYLDAFGLRKDLEHEEQIGEAQYARLHAADLQDQFSKVMGDTPSYGPEAKMSGGYNIRKIFVAKDLAEAFPFKSEQIEGAKKDGTLKEIESLQLDFNTPYDHKAADPQHPNDTEEFIWKPNHLSIRLTNYKIIAGEDKPANNKGNYIEGYRVVDGKQESKPALKIFFPEGGYGAVVLIDTDREGDAGFGVPDILTAMGGLENVRDVVANGQLLATLFQEKKTDKRVMPVHTLFKIEIAPVDKPIDPWQKSESADGWIVPYKYADKTGENYKISIKFKKMKHEDMKAGEEMDMSKMQYREIEYIAKEYFKGGDKYTPSAGQVIEYYRPQGDAAKRCKAEVDYSNDQKVTFSYEDGTEVTSVITPKSKLVADKPYAKSYTEGTQRWWIESSNSDGKYDKRKKTSPPSYSSEESDMPMGGAEQQPHDYNSMAPPCAQTNSCKPGEISKRPN